MKKIFLITSVLIFLTASVCLGIKPLGKLVDQFPGTVTGKLSYSDISKEYTLHSDDLTYSYGIYCKETQRDMLKKNLDKRITLKGTIMVYEPDTRHIDIRPDTQEKP